MFSRKSMWVWLVPGLLMVMAVSPSWGLEVISDEEAALVTGSAEVVFLECQYTPCAERFEAHPCQISALPDRCVQKYIPDGWSLGECVEVQDYVWEGCREWAHWCYILLGGDAIDGECPPEACKDHAAVSPLVTTMCDWEQGAG